MIIYSPSDTRGLVNQNQISNFALRNQRFLDNEVDGGRVKFKVKAPIFGDFQSAISPLRDRQTNQFNYLAKSHCIFCEFYRLNWRMVIGLGGGNVQETNMMLDHIYGIPYVPGSAFKGVVRSWVIQEDFCNDEKLAMRDIQHGDSRELSEKKESFFKVFGTQETSGKVQFLPAYPTEDNITIAVDIMNPHFPNYYTGNELPTDTQDPRPINFLTVEQTLFRFVLLSKEQSLIDLAKDWVDKALRDKGLGAKTAVGYGYFQRQHTDVPRSLRPNPGFEVPCRHRRQRPTRISLDEAFRQFSDPSKSDPDPQTIDITAVKNCATQLAQVVTRDDFIELDRLAGIHTKLIDKVDDSAMASEFGKWIWKKLKTSLLSAKILELPRLIYSSNFRNNIKRLPVEELVAVQEKLIALSNQLEKSSLDIESIIVTRHFYSQGKLVFQTELRMSSK